jgi:hypothetical protein
MERVDRLGAAARRRARDRGPDQRRLHLRTVQPATGAQRMGAPSTGWSAPSRPSCSRLTRAATASSTISHARRSAAQLGARSAAPHP